MKTVVNPNGAVAQFQALATSLDSGAPADTLEQGLKALGEIIGAEGLRPEKEFGEGPDNLLLRYEDSLVIEAKNEARYDAISKRDAEQLLHSVAWFADRYPGRVAVPVMVVSAHSPDSGVVLPVGTRLMGPDDLAGLVAAVQAFVAALSIQAASRRTRREGRGEPAR